MTIVELARANAKFAIGITKKLLRTLVPKQLIGPVLEIRVAKYPANKGKNQETGIAVPVPSTEPEPGQRLTCVNLSYGKIPYARMITSQREKSEVEDWSLD